MDVNQVDALLPNEFGQFPSRRNMVDMQAVPAPERNPVANQAIAMGKVVFLR